MTVCVCVAMITPFWHLMSYKQCFSTWSCTHVLIKQTQCHDTLVSIMLCINISILISLVLNVQKYFFSSCKAIHANTSFLYQV